MRIARAIVALVLLTAGASPSRAWIWGNPIEANIPFEFVVNGTVLAPALYIIEKARTGDSGVLSIRLKDGSRMALMFDTDELALQGDPKAVELVFEKRDGRRYLAEVWGLEANGRGVRSTAAPPPVSGPDVSK